MRPPHPERTKEESLRSLRYAKRVLEALMSGGTQEEIKAGMRSAMRELEKEEMESQGIQDYSSAERTN